MARRVCMLTADLNLIDTRIINEATSLARAGYAVRLIMPSKTAGSYTETVNGFEVCYVAPVLHSHRTLLRMFMVRSWREGFRLINAVYEEQLRRQAPSPKPSSPPPAGGNGETAAPNISGVRSAAHKLGKEIRLTYSYLLLEVPFARVVREFQPEVIHIHDLPMLRVGRMLAEELKAKLVYDSHELYPFQYYHPQDRYLVRFWAGRERADISSPDLVITVNPLLAEALKESYRLDAVHVIHNTAPYENHLEKREASRAWLTKSAPPPGEGACVLLYLGGLAEERGAVEMIEMLSLLPSHYVLVILGDGEVRRQMEQRAAELHLEGRVIFHGMLPREQVPGLIVGADIGLVAQKPVAPCQINCSPNRLSDYLMAGLPLAVSDLPFLRRFVETYGCGALFDPHEPQSMAQAIRGMFEDRGRFEGLRRKALEGAKSFNWDVEGRKFLDLYAKLN